MEVWDVEGDGRLYDFAAVDRSMLTFEVDDGCDVNLNMFFRI